MEQKKIIVFGAGKIGRSFIGQLFSRGGYEVIFVDINPAVVHSLNLVKRYPVVIKDYVEETLWINDVSAILLTDTDEVVHALNSTNLAAICVGSSGFPEAARIIAFALQEREKLKIRDPLDLILAENMRNAGEALCFHMKKQLPPGFNIAEIAGLVETSIGKMVPIMPPETAGTDPLMIYAEAYNDLIVDAKGFKNKIPEIDGLSPKENMKAWVDRKLFIHNLGHAAAAYFGNYYLPSCIFIWEILEIHEIFEKVNAAMHEAGKTLQKIYPGEFSDDHIADHIKDLLKRFRNRALGDTIFRVGYDLPRKLDYEDRLVAPMRMAYINDLPYKNILSALICACSFHAADYDGKRSKVDKILTETYKKYGIARILEKYCKLNPLEYPGIFRDAQYLQLQMKRYEKKGYHFSR